MADDRTNRGAGDRDRINVDQDYELRYWSERLGVTPAQLRQAVEDVGPMVAKVEQHLRNARAS
jgi:hypothetical protein